MFKGKEKWFIYSSIVLAMLVLSVLIVKQLQFAYNLRVQYFQGEGPGISFADHQEIMWLSDSFSKTFFLIFFCFWMILFGALILFTQAERVYKEHAVAETKIFWKAVAPGVLLIISGTLVMAFSLFQYKSARTAYAKLTTADSTQKKSADIVDISHQPSALIDPEAPQEVVKEKSAKEPLVTVAQTEDSAPRTITTLPADKKEHSLVQQPTVKLQPKPVASEVPESEEGASTVQTVKSKAVSTSKISEEDIQWAEYFADQVVMYGHEPAPTEVKRFKQIYEQLKVSAQHHVAPQDMLWAVHFMLKLKGGYNPNPAEMSKYEEVVFARAARTSAK